MAAVLILGASGYVGSHLVPRLVEQGHTVRAAGRRREPLERVAAERAGVGRIVYLGGLQPKGTASTHLASRRETGDVLNAGAVDVTEIRAGIVVGPGSAARYTVFRTLDYGSSLDRLLPALPPVDLLPECE